MIIIAILIALLESISPVLGCIRALVALFASLFVNQAQLPTSISGADPDWHSFRTPKRILRASKSTNVETSEPSDALLSARAEAMFKWSSVHLMPKLIASASEAAVSFCLEHLPSESSLHDMRDCEEVP